MTLPDVSGGRHRPVLFLDFDGVLHPSLCLEAEHFCRRPLFEEVMRRFPAVRIVISSSWRHHFAIERLRPSFSGDIAERIDDTTSLWVPGGPANRFEEIMAFVCSRGLDEAGWLALDDSAFEFPRSCANLVLCDGRFGLTEDVAMRLAGRLALMSGEP
ncbi:MAG: hypothetical protein IPG33_11115 [Betaproteobacteria bacterium]|nr:hypothetical protein [Betaproteobacteria bacterium]